MALLTKSVKMPFWEGSQPTTHLIDEDSQNQNQILTDRLIINKTNQVVHQQPTSSVKSVAIHRHISAQWPRWVVGPSTMNMNLVSRSTSVMSPGLQASWNVHVCHCWMFSKHDILCYIFVLQPPWCHRGCKRPGMWKFVIVECSR